MERSEYRYSQVFVCAQYGPEGDKPFFAWVAPIKTTWDEYEAKLHHKIAQAVLVTQGCTVSPMVICDLEDVPDWLGKLFANQLRDGDARIVAFEPTPEHYEQARRQSQA